VIDLFKLKLYFQIPAMQPLSLSYLLKIHKLAGTYWSHVFFIFLPYVCPFLKNSCWTIYWWLCKQNITW